MGVMLTRYSDKICKTEKNSNGDTVAEMYSFSLAVVCDVSIMSQGGGVI